MGNMMPQKRRQQGYPHDQSVPDLTQETGEKIGVTIGPKATAPWPIPLL